MSATATESSRGLREDCAPAILPMTRRTAKDRRIGRLVVANGSLTCVYSVDIAIDPRAAHGRRVVRPAETAGWQLTLAAEDAEFAD